ncbi:MAG TPA: glycosyltransferase, partial [Planctomycetota bacterium]|nr:glycosyltransferase [Planctomycetota bacterium]
LGAAERMPEVSFLVAGGMNADVARLAKRAEGLANVRLDGFQPPDRIPLYLAAGDLGVVPNRSQPAISARYTSPLKVFEAMAARLPLVVSDLPSLRDILGSQDALFVAPDDPVALAQGIASLLSDPTLRENLGRSLGARAVEHTFEARAQRILEWMQVRSGTVRQP